MDVKHVAKLANLTIKPGEEEKFKQQFAETLKTVDVINKLDTSNVSATARVTSAVNITRKDVVDKSRMIKVGGYFKVKAIFTQE